MHKQANVERSDVERPCEYVSGEAMRHDLHKHTRMRFGPTQKFRRPMTSSQVVGWHDTEPFTWDHHHKSTDLTQYLDAGDKHMYGRSVGGEFSKFAQDRLYDCAGFGMGM